MVKKLKKLPKFNWIRRCSVLMVCALILFASVSPAFAFGVWDPAHDGALDPLLTGYLSFNFYNPSTGVVSNGDDYAAMLGLPSVYPLVPQSVYSDLSNYVERYNNPSSGSVRWAYDINVRGLRKKRTIDSTSFDLLQLYFEAWEYDSDVEGYFGEYSFEFDTFACYLDKDFLQNLIILRLTSSMKVNASAYIWYMNDDDQLVSYNWSGLSGVYGNSNVYPYNGLFNEDFGWQPMLNATGLQEGDPIMITDFEITLTPNSSTDSLHYLSFQLLCEQYWTGNPIYRRDPVKWFLSEVDGDLNYLPPDIPDYEGSFWSEWLGDVITGFFDAEIMPGFSIGGVFSVIMTVIFVLIILKFFAGG